MYVHIHSGCLGVYHTPPNSGAHQYKSRTRKWRFGPALRGAGLQRDLSVQVNAANVRQSRPDSGRGFKVNVFKTFSVVPSSIGSG